MFNLHHQAPEEIDHQQVQGVEHIEEVFADGPLDEAPTTVIEIDGHKCQTCYPTHGQVTPADGSLKDTMMPKHIEQQNETNACAPIVCMEEDAYANEREQNDRQTHSRVFPRFPSVNSIKGEKSQKERKKHILPSSKQTTTARQIEGNL